MCLKISLLKHPLSIEPYSKVFIIQSFLFSLFVKYLFHLSSVMCSSIFSNESNWGNNTLKKYPIVSCLQRITWTISPKTPSFFHDQMQRLLPDFLPPR